MQRIIIGLFGALILLVALALAAPSFVDWNQYKDAVAREAERVTGRNVVIGGDLDLRLLPAPAIAVEDLRLANADGRPEPYMLRLARADIRLAPGALFGGRIRFASVRLVDPVVLIEGLGDGRVNWDLAGPQPGSGPSAAIPVPGTEDDTAATTWTGLSVGLDSIEIENGTVIIRNEAEGTVEQVDGLTATLTARSLSGPFEGEGRFQYADATLAFDAAVGDVGVGGPVPLRIALADGAGAGGEVRGTVSGLGGDAPRLQGRIEGSSADLAAFLARRLETRGPGFLRQAATFSGAVTASKAGAEVRSLSLALGDSRASGSATVTFGEPSRLHLDLRATRLDLDAWLAMPGVEAEAPASAVTGATAGRGPVGPGSAARRWIDRATVAIDLEIDALTWRDGIIRQVQAGGEFADGVLFVRQLSALFPGAAEMALEGSVRWQPIATATGPVLAPRFEGRAVGRSDDLRGVLRWLGVDRTDIPRQHLRSVSFTTALSASPQHVVAEDITAQLDGSTVTGRVTWSRDASPPLAADLTMDRLTADGLLPSSSPATPVASPATDGASGLADPGVPALDLRLRIASLGYRGARMETVVLDGTVDADGLLLRRLSVGDVAGASGWISGMVSAPAERLRVEDLNFEFSVPDPARLLPVFALDVPRLARTIGPVAGSGRLSGTAERAVLDLSVTAAGGSLHAAGAISASGGAPAFVGRTTLRHDDLARLIAALGGRAGPAGGFGLTEVSGTVTADRNGVSITALEGAVAGVSIAGSAAARFSGPRPRIDADLAAGRIAIDRFVAAGDDQASLRQLQPASSTAPRQDGPPPALVEAGVHPRWSRAPFDLGVLRTVDLGLALDAEEIAYGSTSLQRARLRATLDDGRLTIRDLTGRLWEGALAASGHVAADVIPPALDMTAQVTDADLGRIALGSAAGAGEAPGAAGRGDVHLRLAGSGQSMADLVPRLQGSGSMALTGVVVTDAAAAGAAPLLRILKSLDAAGAVPPAIGAPAAGADVTATARIEDGVVRVDDFSVIYGWGRGDAHGLVDLPAWRIDVAGEIAVAPDVWSRLAPDLPAELGAHVTPPARIGFTVQGPIDDAHVRLDAASASGVQPTPGTR